MSRATLGLLAAATLAALAIGIAPLASSSASAAPSTASGRCSKVEATAAVKQLGLSDPAVANPVFKVLCGTFADAGSETMVISLLGQANSGMAGWVVLRWDGSVWKVLLRRQQAALLAPAGSDIKETVAIYGFGDPRCCPKGGTRSHVWHWNGSRFVASPWTLSWPQGSLRYGFFKTPSGNILCNYASDRKSGTVGCVVQSGLKPPGARRRAGCSRDIVVSLRSTGKAYTWGSVCQGEDEPETPYVGGGIAWIFGYGEALNIGAIRCTSATTGLTCRNKSGHGFFLSREKWRSF